MITKISDNNVQAMFNEGRLVARALEFSPLTHNGKMETVEVDKEISYLNSKLSEGNYKNVERNGQRGRSATLLAPEIKMSLMYSVGFIYDADESTIKAYMFHDSQTMSQLDHNNYYNVNEDKKKFEPILSRRQFLIQYKRYMEMIDNPQKRDDKKDYRKFALLPRYNEVLGNFFPKSLVGLVGCDDTIQTKVNLLALKNHMINQHHIDLPMTMMTNGNLQVWKPNIDDISALLEQYKSTVHKIALRNKLEPLALLNKTTNLMGYTLDIKDFTTSINPTNVRKNDQLKVDELITYLNKITNMPKGGVLTYGIKGRLKEVINQRLIYNGLPKITSLQNCLIDHEDIKNLVTLLNNELVSENKNHVSLNGDGIKKMTDNIIKTIIELRNNPSNPPAVTHTMKFNQFKAIFKIQEFFAKVASLIVNNNISNKNNFFYQPAANSIDDKIETTHKNNFEI